MINDLTSRTAPAGAPPDALRWKAFIVLVLAAFMDLLDNTITAVALPSIQKDLGATYAALQWISAGYGLAFAAGLITGGRLGDIYGRKKIFLIGVTGFIAASALCGVAQSPGMLVASRAAQGAMAAIMVPQMLSIIRVTFPPNETPKAFGIWGAVSGLSALMGPPISGLLLKANIAGLGWRPIFLLNIPVGVIALVGASRLVKESKSPFATRLDLPGVGLAVATLLAIVIPLVEGRELGWPVWSIVLLVAAIPLALAFVAYSRGKTARNDSPLLDTSLFASRGFVGGILVSIATFAAIPAFFLMFTIHLQIGLGFTPLHAGLTGLPFSLAATASAGASFRLTPKFGRKVQMIGTLLLSAAMTVLALTAGHYGTALRSVDLIPGLVIGGLGMGMVVPPLVNLVLTAVPPRSAGSASGTLVTAQQVGGAFGVALMGLMFFGLLGHYSGTSTTAAAPTLRATMAAASVPAASQDAIITSFGDCLHARDTRTNPDVDSPACTTLDAQVAQLPASVSGKLHQQVAEIGQSDHRTDSADSFSRSLFMVVGLFLVAFGLTRLLPKGAGKVEVPAPGGERVPQGA